MNIEFVLVMRWCRIGIYLWHPVYDRHFLMTETINMYFIHRCTLHNLFHMQCFRIEGQDPILNGINSAIIYLRRKWSPMELFFIWIPVRVYYKNSDQHRHCKVSVRSSFNFGNSIVRIENHIVSIRNARHTPFIRDILKEMNKSFQASKLI